MPVYDYRCDAGHTQEVTHRMLYSTGVVCECGAPMQRVPQAARVNWNGGRAGREPAPAIAEHIRNIDARRDDYRQRKEAYEAEKRRIGRD